jgi:hypothetical protein
MKWPPGSRSGLKIPLGLLESPIIGIMVFQGGDDGLGYRNMCKIAGRSKSNLSHWHLQCSSSTVRYHRKLPTPTKIVRVADPPEKRTV